MTDSLTQFKSTLVYEAAIGAQQLQADLQEIREFDRQAESRVRKYKILAWSSLVSLCLSAWLGFMTNHVFLLTIAGLSLLALCLGVVLYWTNAKFDLANRRYELLGELVRLLGRDMARDALFDVKLDLTAADSARKKSGTGTAGTWKVTYFTDPWLALSGRLADGTAFQIGLVDRFQNRSKWKRSSSGKHKRKTKTKSSTQTSVRLYPKAKRYADLPKVVDEAENYLQLPAWVGLKKLEATADELALTTFTKEGWSVRRLDPGTAHDGVEMVGTMLLSLYQVLHASTAGSRS